MFSTERLIQIALTVLLVMVSAVLHELAHGWVALRCGDATAKEAGRLTLNPKAHLDPFGSILLPLLMGFMGGPVFAFAKPVPYNPRRLKSPRRDELLVALAGPACNVLQALVGTVALWVLFNVGGATPLVNVLPLKVAYWLSAALSSYVWVNLILCFFNLVPFPPLDGSKVVLFFLSGRARQKFYELSQYSMFLLLLLLYVLPSFLHIDPLGAYFDLTAGPLYEWLLGMV